MAKPFLSLILTSYNLERYIGEALLSILAQEYDGPKELIIVDDASTDNTHALLQSLLAEHGAGWDYKLVRAEENGGVAMALDRALALAKGDWAVLIDGDDIQLNDRCSKTAELIARHPQATMINMSAELIDAEGTPYGMKSYAFGAYGKAEEELVCATVEERRRNYLTFDDLHIDAYGCTMAINMALYRRWGSLQEGVAETRFLQDSTWAMRATLSGEIVGSKLVACRYRSHNANILNREWKGGAEGVRERELFQSRRQAFFAATHRRKLADVQRALADAALSDWDAGSLQQLRRYVENEISVADMRAGWWSLPWWRRLAHALGSIGRVPARMCLWPWWRLLPLDLLCRLKSMKG